MSEAAETKTFRLSKRLAVTITVGVSGLVCEWDPGLPAKLTAKELRRYRAARHKMVSSLAERTGGMVVVVDA
jgi:hypothetical protein